MQNETEKAYFPKWIIVSSKLISILFHPLFVGVMMAAYLIFIHPDYFVGFSEKAKMLKLLAVINNNVFFPLLLVALMKGLGFSKSIFLTTQKERIVPYIGSITFFFWTYYVFKHQPETPRIIVNMCRGMFFASSAALLLNNYYKISMHGIGVGGMMGLMVLTVFDGTLYTGLPLLVSALVSGLVMSSRKVVSDHHWFDIITGFLVGFLCQLIALWV